jgi:predicted PurR-regulated permease PerM
MSLLFRRLEPLLGLAALLIVVIGCFVVLRPFLAALLWATILSISTWPAFRWVEAKLGGRTTAAAAVMTLLLAVGFLVPLSVLGTSLAENFAKFASNVLGVLESGLPPPPEWIAKLPLLGDHLQTIWMEYAEDTPRFAQAVREYVGPATQWLIGVGTKVGRGIFDLALSVLVAFFFFRDGAYGATRLQVVLDKVAGPTGHHLLAVAEKTMIGVVYGILGTALAQGALAAFGLYIAGVPGALFLGVLTSLLSFIPFGPPAVWLPATIWLFSVGQVEWGIFMGIWGMAIVSTVDNIIRPYFISLGSTLPLLLVYLGVLGGIIGFGFLGLFIGPTLLAIAYTIIREWSHSKAIDALNAAEQAPPEDPIGPGPD